LNQVAEAAQQKHQAAEVQLKGRLHAAAEFGGKC
jgi:hypothetical protein